MTDWPNHRNKAQAMKLYIVIYTHRHGTSVWPIYADAAPSTDDVIAGMDCWEGDREDESIEVVGPFATSRRVPA